MKREKAIGLSSGLLALFALTLGAFGLFRLDAPVGTAKDGLANWMEEVADGVSLADLSLPGTHDSGAYSNFLGVAGQCQDLTIKRQLEYGTRFLDMRLKNVNGTLAIYHGFINMNLKFADVLADVYAFLDDNPEEAIIMSLKEEGAAENSESTLDELLEAEILKAPSNWLLGREIPTLGEARGKIVPVSRFKGNSFGLDFSSAWQDSASFELGSHYVQDYYKVDDVEKKKGEVLKAFGVFRSESQEGLVLNFLSGYLNASFPPMAAASIAREMKDWALETVPASGGTGVLIMDFLSVRLAAEIIELNGVEL